MLRINNLFVFHFFLLYVTLTGLFHFLDISLLKYMIFTISLATIGLLTTYVFKNIEYLSNNLFIFFVYLTTFILSSSIINIGDTSIVFSIKYFGLVIFFLTGYIINVKSTNDSYDIHYQKKVLIGILLLPIIVYVVDVFLLAKSDSASIFLNRNNAVLFGIITSYFLIVFFNDNKKYILFIVGNVILYKTLGALIAMIVTMSLIYIKTLTIKNFILFFFYALFFVSILLYSINNLNIGIFNRVEESIAGFKVLFTLSSIEEMVNISYGQMASLSGSTDLSFLFRIKHWFNILSIYFNADFIHILFGHGNDSIRYLTSAELRAHNDYIRLLFEVGLLFWITFVSFNFYLLRLIGINITVVPFMIVLMYFFTENLIDNFLSMSLLYFMVGLIVARKKRKLI